MWVLTYKTMHLYTTEDHYMNIYHIENMQTYKEYRDGQ
jgi:hypothetical protein